MPSCYLIYVAIISTNIDYALNFSRHALEGQNPASQLIW